MNEIETTEQTPLIEPQLIKCWACWETTHTYSNPLIRVCHGCKDPELQYIHQSCIDNFITSLPTPRRPRSPLSRPSRPDLESQDLQSQTVQEFLQEEPVFYYCTRCRDAYTVKEVTIFPLFVILKDKWLRIIFILLVFAFVTMISTFVAIVQQHYEEDSTLFDFFGYQVTVMTLALLLIIIGIACAIGLGVTIWMTASGKKRLTVVGSRLLL